MASNGYHNLLQHSKNKIHKETFRNRFTVFKKKVSKVDNFKVEANTSSDQRQIEKKQINSVEESDNDTAERQL